VPALFNKLLKTYITLILGILILIYLLKLMTERTLCLFKSCTLDAQIEITSPTVPINTGQFINSTTTLITLMLNLLLCFNIILKYSIKPAYNVKDDLTGKVSFRVFLLAQIKCFFFMTIFIISLTE
jgi:hypothetical protein